MDCILCQFGKEMEGKTGQEFPDPIASSYRAPANRAPVLHDRHYGHYPGTPSYGLAQYAPPTRPTNPNVPTDLVNPLPRAAAEAGDRLRWIRMQWMVVGGPACTAPNQPGWWSISPTGDGEGVPPHPWLTIDDFDKPALALPRYTYASIDLQEIIDRTKKSIARALYGGGK